ncbi:hypothetical protein Q3G72_019816 [Acer saccharum]|nr:hypothetical protein Q3G72_019816 [Acer saccharum]
MVMTLEDLKSIDDESFNRLVKKAEEAANGDEELKLELMKKASIKNLVNKLVFEEKEEASTSKIPKKHRSSRRGSVDDKSLVENDKSLKICFCSVQTKERDDHDHDYDEEEEEEEEEAIKKPPLKKQRKSDNSKKKKMMMMMMNYDENEPGLLDPPPALDIPEEVRNYIERRLNGTDIMLVIEKKLTATDMNKGENRLSVPRKQVRADFLTEEEKEKLGNKLKKKVGIEVLMIQPCLKEATGLVLKRWNMSETFSYALIGKWTAAVVENETNGLRTGSLVQLWSFRFPKESSSKLGLGFALVNLNPGEENL